MNTKTIKPKAPRLSWRKQPSEQGLARIGQAPRGAILSLAGEEIGRVYPRSVGGWGHVYKGWYWTARDNAGRVPLANTCDKPVATIEDAKAACEAYVRECLAKVAT